MKREEKVDTQIGSKLLFPISKEIGLRRPALAIVLILVVHFLSVSLALGQATANSTGYEPTLPGPGPVITLSSVAQPLDETCVVAVLNRTTQVNHDGTWILAHHPCQLRTGSGTRHMRAQWRNTIRPIGSVQSGNKPISHTARDHARKHYSHSHRHNHQHDNTHADAGRRHYAAHNDGHLFGRQLGKYFRFEYPGHNTAPAMRRLPS